MSTRARSPHPSKGGPDWNRWKGSEFIVEVQQKTIDDTPIGDYREHLAKAMETNEEYSTQLVAPDAKILIVDDEEMIRNVIKEYAAFNNYETDEAADGMEAVEMVKNKDYGTPVPNYVDENVSTKVVKLIQSYTGVVNKMVWRKTNA